MSHTIEGPIVITGARGYIGAALTLLLRNRGCAVRCVSRAGAGGPLAEGADHVSADLSRVDSWLDVLAGSAGLVHLAARTDLRAAEADEAGDYEINVRPLKALVEACEALGGPPLPVVFASTATIFGANPALPADETTPDDPLSVYDRHKLLGERMLASATRAGSMSARSLRLANVYGAIEQGPSLTSVNANRGVLNAMMLRALRGEPLTLFGSGKYLRDFVHLEDVLEAIVAALNPANLTDGGTFLIASGQGHSLSEAFHVIRDEVRQLTGRQVEIRSIPEPDDLHPSERRNFVGNPSRFAASTGWAPRVSLKDGVRRFLLQAAAAPAPQARGERYA